jgi:hypothetical protein
MTTPEDDRLDAALARALGPDADDTAPLSRAVLSRLAERPAPGRAPLAEVLADPRPVAGLMLGALLLAGALGYALLPADLEEAAALILILGPGF